MQAALLGPMSVHDFDFLLQRLPAQQQAAIRWMRPLMRQAYDRLLNEQPSPTLLHEVTASFLRHSLERRDIVQLLLEKVDESAVWATLTHMWEQQARLLHTFFHTAEHARTAEHVLGALCTLTRVNIRVVQLGSTQPDWAEAIAEARTELDALTLEDQAAHPSSAELRSWLLIGSVLDAAEQGHHRKRAVELVWWAHQELRPLEGPLAEVLEELDLGPELIRLPWFQPDETKFTSELPSGDETRIVLSAEDFERVQVMLESDAAPPLRLREALARRRQRMLHGIGS